MDTHPHRIGFAHCMLMAALCSMAALVLAADVSAWSDFEFPPVNQNVARINQVGNGNTASIDQGSEVGTSTKGQYADIAQAGDGNQATVLQMGEQNKVRISQDGWDTATVSQQGSGNSVDLVQGSNGKAVFRRFDGNTFSATQNGSNNSINGNGLNINATDIADAFDPNIYGSAIQRGLRNAIDVVQNNDNNSLSAVQIGNDNVIIFTQNGGTTARLSEIGDRNTISLIQNKSVMAVKDIALIGSDMKVTATAN